MQRVFSERSGAAAHVAPADLSHANDNPSSRTKTQVDVGVSRSVFPATHIAVDALESQFQERRARPEASHS